MKKMPYKIILIFLLFKSVAAYAQVPTLTGINTTSPNSTLHINGSVAGAIKVVGASYTLTTNDHTLILSGVVPAGSITVTFPSAVSCPGRIYVIVNYTSASVNSTVIASQIFSSYDGTAQELKATSGTSATSAIINSTTSTSGPSAGIQVTNMRTTWQSDGNVWWLIGL